MRRIVRIAAYCLIASISFACALREDTPRSVILFIGDGMGPGQIEAGRAYLGRALSFESFPARAIVRTDNAYGEVTDSAASATAMATGVKVANGVLSLALPGSGEELETILERVSSQGWRTGLATTVYTTHATPAAFGAHDASRVNYDAIADDYMSGSRPSLILGGGANGLDEVEAVAAGYLVVDSKEELASVSMTTTIPIAGLFGTGYLPYEYDGGPNVAGYPDLDDMTREAIRLLENAEGGFFLMVESGLIDQAAHRNDAARMVGEVVALDRAVTEALSWASDRSDVLIIVTADHETGGITSVADTGTGNIPAVTWTTTGHTATPVDLYAYGAGSERFLTILDNTDIHAALLELLD